MTYFRVYAWTVVVIGILGSFGSLDPFDGMSLFGCLLWLATGFVLLNLIDRVEAKESK